ncbi:hypothetical protein DDE82_006673 [Stemphylium lycopersici]|uniref:Uncharacterized protein n=1 Tax=Stemphylium lycopersici TaxID=183478 RepID=A0A364N655_STELY|nr:hypothetical protein DDE82_006673 [Stemphylium lycopersici]RAR12746.1 hypothetical protein DDE83_003894 [Stemphylium lycopersici]
MNHVRATRSVCRRMAIQGRPGQLSRRTYAAETAPPHPPSSPPNPNSTGQAPPPPLPPKEPSRVGAYYGTFGSPILKCFLGALFTYQITYYLWYKLETIEETHAARSEVAELQQELRQALEKQRLLAQEKWGQAAELIEKEKEELGQAVDAVVDEVREGADEVGKGTRAVGKVAGGGWWPW